MTELTWATATSLADLGELTARWLEGALPDSPSYGGGPDPETLPLVPDLVAINRAGLVTDFSQPGMPDDGDGSKQRAAVTGFCDEPTRERLAAALAATDLVFMAESSDDESAVRIPVTIDVGEPFTWVGGAILAEYLADSYEGLSERALRLLKTSWYVTVFDPVWGRNDLLWPALVEALTRRESP